MFGRNKDKSIESLPEMDLDELIACLGKNLKAWQAQPKGMQWLAQARLADACRDEGIVPVATEAFQAMWMQCKDAQHRQFGLLTATLDLTLLRQRLVHHAPNHRGDAVLRLLQQHLTSVALLPLDVLEQSDVRLEEFARHFCRTWQVRIAKENLIASEKRLHEINFGRLMKEADQARASAEDRMAYLRDLQRKEEENKRARRGKW